jgi:sugar transferase EpsL
VRSSAYTRFVKRLIDISVVLLLAPIWIPVLVLVALAVRLRLGSPIFFRQQRPGYAARPFQLVKFRSMTDRRGADGQLLPDSERLPPFGRWLRSTSLDELPELINILRGEMSLVGPRPLLTQYLERYSARQARRHLAKPGLTGWSQVNGRNYLDWDDKLEMDAWYADNVSLQLDLKILFLTLGAVFRSEGVHIEGSVTPPEFMGSAPTYVEDRPTPPSTP